MHSYKLIFIYCLPSLKSYRKKIYISSSKWTWSSSTTVFQIWSCFNLFWSSANVFVEQNVWFDYMVSL